MLNVMQGRRVDIDTLRNLAVMMSPDGQLPTKETHVESGQLFANGQHMFSLYRGSQASELFRAEAGTHYGFSMRGTREYLYFPEQKLLLDAPVRSRPMPATCHLHNDIFLVSDVGTMDYRRETNGPCFHVHKLDLLNLLWTSLTVDLSSLFNDEQPIGLVHDLLLDESSGDLIFFLCRFSKTKGKVQVQRLILRCQAVNGTFVPLAFVELEDAPSYDIALLDNETGCALVIRETCDSAASLTNMPAPRESQKFPFDWKILQLHEHMQICGSSGKGIYFSAREDNWIMSPAGSVMPSCTLRAMTAVIGNDGIRHEFFLI